MMQIVVGHKVVLYCMKDILQSPHRPPLLLLGPQIAGPSGDLDPHLWQILASALVCNSLWLQTISLALYILESTTSSWAASKREGTSVGINRFRDPVAPPFVILP